MVINDRTINVLAEALGGSNVDNCPHPCITNPCGPDGQCIPVMDYFTCECNTVSYGSGCQIQVVSLLCTFYHTFRNLVYLILFLLYFLFFRDLQISIEILRCQLIQYLE